MYFNVHRNWKPFVIEKSPSLLQANRAARLPTKYRRLCKNKLQREIVGKKTCEMVFKVIFFVIPVKYLIKVYELLHVCFFSFLNLYSALPKLDFHPIHRK
jgi:hypothetical protein